MSDLLQDGIFAVNMSADAPRVDEDAEVIMDKLEGTIDKCSLAEADATAFDKYDVEMSAMLSYNEILAQAVENDEPLTKQTALLMNIDFEHTADRLQVNKDDLYPEVASLQSFETPSSATAATVAMQLGVKDGLVKFWKALKNLIAKAYASAKKAVLGLVANGGRVSALEGKVKEIASKVKKQSPKEATMDNAKIAFQFAADNGNGASFANLEMVNSNTLAIAEGVAGASKAFKGSLKNVKKVVKDLKSDLKDMKSDSKDKDADKKAIRAKMADAIDEAATIIKKSLNPLNMKPMDSKLAAKLGLDNPDTKSDMVILRSGILLNSKVLTFSSMSESGLEKFKKSGTVGNTARLKMYSYDNNNKSAETAAVLSPDEMKKIAPSFKTLGKAMTKANDLVGDMADFQKDYNEVIDSVVDLLEKYGKADSKKTRDVNAILNMARKNISELSASSSVLTVTLPMLFAAHAKAVYKYVAASAAMYEDKKDK